MNEKKRRGKLTSDKKKQQITFKVGIEGKPDQPIEINGYLFNDQGGVVATEPLHEGVIRFEVANNLLKKARLFIGPKISEEKLPAKLTMNKLERMQAYEPIWQYEDRKDVYEVKPIPGALWPWWPRCTCRVRGRILKRTTVEGVTTDRPVCDARVHICEVDRLPRLIARLPDDMLIRVRDELFKIWEEPPRPIPDPEPDPWFHDAPKVVDPNPKISREIRLAKLTQSMGNPQPEPISESRLVQSKTVNMSKLPVHGYASLGPQPIPPGLPPEIHFAMASNAIPLVRKTIVENIELIRPWVCIWEWLWPYFHYDCDEAAVVITDSMGRFDTSIAYPCLDDRPDLYFWVEYSIGESWETVYRPRIACHTHWDYACGNEVTIRITDPRVHGCGDFTTLYGKKVVVKSIGRNVSMGEIYREGEGLTFPVTESKNGTVKEGWLHSHKNSPFGEILEPRVDFGKGLKDAGITHYRWSYQELGEENEDAWIVINSPVTRRYRELSDPGEPPVYKVKTIGPAEGISGYYVEIDPELPTNAEDWAPSDERYDLASARLDTRALDPGKYELKLELFRQAGTGMERVIWDDEDIELYEVNDAAPFEDKEFTSEEPTDDRKYFEEATGNLLLGYRLVVHVDNRECFGNVLPVTVTPGNIDLKCGFLEYGPGAEATVSFQAAHPDNFAYFDFDLVRVSTQLPSASANGLVGANTVNGFGRVGMTFTKSIKVDTLFNERLPVGETACTRAAFAEGLWVYALATNGYNRLRYLDAPRAEDPNQIRLRGFALTPLET